MSVSNKTLSILLLAAIVVSLGGTFVSLNRLGAISTTARLTDEAGGTVGVTINETLSITTDTDTISFGTCTLGDGGTGITISSNISGGNAENSCPSFTASYIAVRNNGNIDANVTIESNVTGGTGEGAFMWTASASTGETALRYKIIDDGDGTNSGGCTGTLGSASFTPFAAADTAYNACDDLKAEAEGGDNSILVHFQIVLPDNTAPTTDTALITFRAEPAVGE